MGSARRFLFVVLLFQVSLAAPLEAAVQLTATRAETLYAADAMPDCSKLSKLPDDGLPLSVVRLRAQADGAPAAQTTFRWSMRGRDFGLLVADLDIGPSAQSAAVAGLCAEFGDACVLTPDKLPFYTRSSILWVAPTCDILPKTPFKPFRGGTSQVFVVAETGRRKLGRASVKIGYGHTASVTLYADGQDGVGNRGGIPSDINPQFGAAVNPNGVTLPAPNKFEFGTGTGESSSVDPAACRTPGSNLLFAACKTDFLYTQAGKFVATVAEKFMDGSALCDSVGVRILSATIIPRLVVELTPKRATFASGDSVNLRVRLVNASPRVGGSGILLIGEGVLTCDEAANVRTVEQTKKTVFDLQHCSGTANQGCTRDADCNPLFCQACGQDETCLTQAHCSSTLTWGCQHDSDCAQSACPACKEDETCVQVLATPAIVVPVGGSVDLINGPVALHNVFPDPAKLMDTWTVHTFNQPVPVRTR
ncbi:MAG: hypothetical protein E6J75_01945 [Deltaproteobacteria bacterium]|nr:MAG: hypothetical protein E6J75_01945 [Deltaproteobacteria bacterium]